MYLHKQFDFIPKIIFIYISSEQYESYLSHICRKSLDRSIHRSPSNFAHKSFRCFFTFPVREISLTSHWSRSSDITIHYTIITESVKSALDGRKSIKIIFNQTLSLL